MHGKQQWVEKLASKQKEAVIAYEKEKMKKNKGAQTLGEFKKMLIMRSALSFLELWLIGLR